METVNGYVRTQRDGAIATIEFHHPQGNSLPGELLRSLAEAVRKAGDDAEAKVVVLRSAGEKAFCAGASFDELRSITDDATGKRFFTGFAEVINAMRTCPKFIIGRIQGRCVGGGVGLASATDYCLAREGASVKLSELAVGIGPFVVGPAVERKIGKAAFCELAIDASRWREASWAHAKGLFTQLHHDIESLDAAVGELADSLAKANPEAMAELKKTFWQGTEDWDRLLEERAGISGRLVLSDFTRQALASFGKGK
jgi:methylglutaconyl-CoA hydratase